MAGKEQLKALLRQRAIDQAEGWRPEVGDTVTGTIAGMKRGKGKYGEYPLIVVETGDGEFVAVHMFHGIAKQKVVDAKPNIGDRIEIGYHGLVSLKNSDNDAHDYTVNFPDATGSKFDWAF